jgi:hypothetical protein
VNAVTVNVQKTENRSAGVQEGGAASTPVEQYEVIYFHYSKLLGCRLEEEVNLPISAKSLSFWQEAQLKLPPCFINHHVLRSGHIAPWILNVSIRPE